VDRVRAQHVAAVNAGDLEAALDIFAPDAAVMPPGQPVLQGAALRAWFTHVFANFSLRGFEIRPEAADQYGNAVIEHGNWTATLEPRNGSPSQPVGGTYVTAYARLANGSVRVVRDIFNGMPG
jgi:ketosteroid isomerase-like protein